MPDRLDNDKPIVLHVVSYDIARGAEVYARSLVDVLNKRDGATHLIATLFSGDDRVLRPDVELDVPRGLMRRLGIDPRVISRLSRTIERLQPRVVVAHGGEPAKYLAVSAKDRPYVYLVIGSNHPRLRNPMRRWLRHLYVGRAGSVVAVSRQLADEIEESVPTSRGRVHVIPNGRDPDVYRPSGSPSGGIPRVIFVGHLDPQKRPEWFIDTMRGLEERNIEFAATMVGGGRLDAALEDDANSLGIEMLGARDDVPALLASADLLVSTSRPPEGMPGVLIEAGLAGLAVVTTEVPGASDIVEDGVTGLVVGVDNKPGLLHAVETLLGDEDQRHRMGAAARERCARLFSLETSAGKWETLLAGLAP